MSSSLVSMGRQKIAEIASRHRQVTTLHQHLNREWLEEAYRLTRKDGVSGIDGQTAEEFAETLPSNLDALVDGCKSGRYRAPPVRRTYIPKNATESRALGIPTFADKVLQRGIVMMLEPIYEQTFYDCSYGFRPGRSPHDCIKDLRGSLHEFNGGYVLDVDIRGYFDSIPKKTLRDLLAIRVGDGIIQRMIGKWLKAGVMEGKEVSYSDTGTPQGGVISPLLANVYLHHILDEWYHEVARKHLRHPSKLLRFADDFVAICKSREDAERLLRAITNRLQRFGLEVHEGKTQIVDFNRPPRGYRGKSFNFLGFTVYWGRSRRGRPTIKLKTAKDRFSRACTKVNELCRTMRHEPIKEQHRRLNAVLRGHSAYYGVSFNTGRLWALRYFATLSWHKWLNRRSQRSRLTWARFQAILNAKPLFRPKVMVPLW